MDAAEPMLSRSSVFIRRVTVVYLVFLLALSFVSNSIAQLMSQYLQVGGSSFLDEAALLGFFAVAGVNVAVQHKVRLSPSYLAVGVFLVFGIVSTLLHHVPVPVAMLGGLQALKPVLIFAAAFSLALGEGDKQWFLAWFDRLMTALVVGVLAYTVVFEWVLGTNPMPPIAALIQDQRLGLTAIRAFYGHPGTLAEILLLASLYHCTSWLVRDRSRWRALLCLASIFLMYATLRLRVMFTFPFLAFLIYLLLVWTEGRLTRPTLRMAGAILGIALVNLVVLGVLLVNLWLPRIAIGLDALRSSRGTITPSARRALFDGAVKINLENGGLGAGFGMFGSPASARYRYSPLYERFGISSLMFASAENPAFLMDQWWAWFLGETGVFGFIAFLTFLIWIGWGIVTIVRRRPRMPPAEKVVALLAVAALVYGIGSGFVTSFLSGPSISYSVFTLSGLTYAMNRRPVSGPEMESH